MCLFAVVSVVVWFVVVLSFVLLLFVGVCGSWCVCVFGLIIVVCLICCCYLSVVDCLFSMLCSVCLCVLISVFVFLCLCCFSLLPLCDGCVCYLLC